MPLNFSKVSATVVLVLGGFLFVSYAQTTSPSPSPSPVSAPPPATSGDVMRTRISKAKAFIAVRNYNAAIYELESIRKESSDVAVHSVVNVLLMNSYLEQGDYKRAQDFLNESFRQQKTTKPNAGELYVAVASQVIKGARTRAERYRSLGLSIRDRMLPLEALNDLEKMRETLELVITQSKEMGKIPAREGDAMALLEEATTSRSMLARDDYDARKWRDEVADTREVMANSRSVVLSAVSSEPVNVPKVETPQQPKAELVAATNNPPVVMQPVSDTRPDEMGARPANDAPVGPQNAEQKAEPKTEPKVETEKPAAVPEKTAPQPVTEPTPNVAPPTKETAPAPNTSKSAGPLDVGSLLAYATRQATPTYPSAARSIRSTGIVRVDVTVDEAGDVTEIQKTSGPALLQAAARDAIKKWKFKPFLRDGQPVKAIGFVNFNFAL